MHYPNFHDSAKGQPLCQTVSDRDMFFPDPEELTPRQMENAVTAAKQVCKECPYLAECFRWGYENDEPGIWGATTQRERRLLRRRLVRSGRPMTVTV